MTVRTSKDKGGLEKEGGGWEEAELGNVQQRGSWGVVFIQTKVGIMGLGGEKPNSLPLQTACKLRGADLTPQRRQWFK